MTYIDKVYLSSSSSARRRTEIEKLYFVFLVFNVHSVPTELMIFVHLFWNLSAFRIHLCMLDLQ